jgi:hypothetical protein
MKTCRILGSIAALLLIACVALPAYAAEGERGGHGGAVAGAGHGNAHFDARYQHNQFYPSRGTMARELPRGAVAVDHYGGRYWYGRGVWWGRRGPGWVVVGPPIGFFVPFLPEFYTTVWFGGVPYYYANDAYYVWRDQDRGYEVVDPPGEAGASTEPPAPEDVFMYPRNGQSADQQSRDRYECHRWAADQTGFDPTRPEGGVGTGAAAAKRGEYFRAMSACLEGRGYSVK